MSNDVTNAMRKWQGPPSQKAVLMSLCDGAAEDGLVPDWRSPVAALCEWTCLGRTAVIEALKALQAAGAITIERSFGRTNRIRVLFEASVDASNQSATQTGTPAEPVRETDRHQFGKRTTPVRETDGTSPAGGPLTPIHQEHQQHQGEKSPRKRSAPKPNKPVVHAQALVDAGFPQDVADEFIAHKAALKAPLTERAWRDHLAEAQKAGWTPLQAAEKVMARGWKGFEAKYVANDRHSVGSSMSFAERDDLHARMKAARFTNKPVDLASLSPAQRAEAERLMAAEQRSNSVRALGLQTKDYEHEHL